MLVNNIFCCQKISAYVKFCAWLTILNSVEICILCFYDNFSSIFVIFTVLRLVDLHLQLKALDIPIVQVIILLLCPVEQKHFQRFHFLERFFYNANRKRYSPEIQVLEMPKQLKTGGSVCVCVCVLNYETAAWIEYFSPNSELVKSLSGSK